MKRLTLIALVAVLALSLAGCSQPAAPADSGAAAKPSKVALGFAAPLTGDNAVYGQGMKNAVEMAIAEVNASPEGTESGITFSIAPQDDQGDPKQAVNVANALVGNPDVAAVVGHFNSGCSIPASAVYNRAGMAMVSVSSNPQLTAQGFKVVNRIVPKDDAQGSFAAGLVKKLGYANVALLDDSTPYGEGLAKEFRKQYETDGGKIVVAEKIQSKETDFKALVTKIKSLSPAAIYYGGAHVEGALLSKQASEAGVKVPLIGGDMLYTEEFIKIAGAANAEGDICTILGLPIDQQPGGAAFIEAYKAKFNKGPEAYDSYAYDSAKVIMAAIIKAGTADRVKVAEAIRAGSYDGVTGTTSFDANGDTTNKAISAYKVEGGKWAQIKE
ncbi:MAG: branched-chain amino acid ABC transporter substrate-binding protein [Coriobacteriia bacterium]|nr:branched-chain amino acid ABC transporter substrate-binding protein [Coriobacteriia bacterium]